MLSESKPHLIVEMDPNLIAPNAITEQLTQPIPVASGDVNPPDGPNLFNRLGNWARENRWRTGVYAAAGLTALGGIAYGVSLIPSDRKSNSFLYANAVASCNESVIAPAAFTGPNQILPTTASISSNGEAATYNEGLFHKSSATATLGGKINPGSEAILSALIGDPAVNGTSETNFSQAVRSFYAEMSGSNKAKDLQTAESLCAENQYVMSNTDSYSNTAISVGEGYIAIKTEENASGFIDGAKVAPQSYSSVDIPGVVYSANGARNGIHFFFNVVVPKNANGQIDVLGSGLEVSNTPDTKSTTTTTSNTNNGTTGVNGGTSSTAGNGVGVHSGPAFQENQLGPAQVTTGPAPTPGPGEKTIPTTAPPEETTTTTAPPEETTTTTLPPNKTGGGTCDPNISPC